VIEFTYLTVHIPSSNPYTQFILVQYSIEDIFIL
jgi:hypothetical protein